MTAAVKPFASVLIAVLFAAATADAACPDRRASCVLHEEGVELFLQGKHEEAAAKFAAAIAAEPTARSYLGYAQAVEALGQIALAYDTLVAAQRLSQAEVQASGGKEVDVNARAERIKYKLGELRAKIAFVWLRVPNGVPPQRVVAVKRQGEGDLAQPLTQWTAVAPNKQVLIATIDDGTQLEIVANVAAGSQGVVVIPIPAPQPVVQQPPIGARPPMPGVYMPVMRPVPPAPVAYLSFGLSLLAPGPENFRLLGEGERASSGYGFSIFYEKRIANGLGLATRFEYANHGAKNGSFFDPADEATEVSAWELVMLAGLRTMGSRTVHGRVGAGVSLFTQNAEGPNAIGGFEEFTRAYPALELGGGLHLGRLRMQMGLLLTAAGDAEVKLGTRFMGTIGIDLWRKDAPARPAPATAAPPPVGPPR